MSPLRSARVSVLIVFFLYVSAPTIAKQRAAATNPETTKVAHNDVPETCPVTKSSDNPFVPPWPYAAKSYEDGFWFGTDRLWTAPPANGIWRAVHFWTTDPASGDKIDWWRQGKVAWWRQGVDWRSDGASKLKVTGRYLNSLAPPLVAEVAAPARTKDGDSYVLVGINFPTLGCWEITGRYDDDELTFIVWVAE